MKTVKYKCQKCDTMLEIPPSSVKRTVECDKCKTKFIAEPDMKYATYSWAKLSLNQKRKYCLWIGTGIMDFAGIAILYDRVVVYRHGFRYYEWSALDGFFLITLIIITTAVIFYTLSLTDKKPKDEQNNSKS